jgi:large subunit ribosomal protein L21
VLFVSTDDKTLVGSPTVADARVITKVVREGRGEKIIVFKYKSKKRYRRTQGHRQDYMYLLVTDIQADGKSLVADEDRKRYESSADRQARRFEAHLMSAYQALGVEAPEIE